MQKNTPDFMFTRDLDYIFPPTQFCTRSGGIVMTPSKDTLFICNEIHRTGYLRMLARNCFTEKSNRTRYIAAAIQQL
jgi:hypothetical protein